MFEAIALLIVSHLTPLAIPIPPATRAAIRREIWFEPNELSSPKKITFVPNSPTRSRIGSSASPKDSLFMIT